MCIRGVGLCRMSWRVGGMKMLGFCDLMDVCTVEWLADIVNVYTGMFG